MAHPMTQQIVHPKDIESELVRIWEELVKENKTRASLFNLIVYTKLNKRSDYIRSIVQKVLEIYPCRILFITSDPDFSKQYVKTAVSVVATSGDSHIACDHIDVGVAGEDYHKVPFIVLPHILPDLPVYLLWAEDPCLENPLFASFEKLTHRIIFDSESSENLAAFGEMIQKYHNRKRAEVSDLNWARFESWRDLLTAQFASDIRMQELQNAEAIDIHFNAQESDFFCHSKVQSHYLIGWLAARLGWSWKNTEGMQYTFQGNKEIKITLKEEKFEGLSTGAITGIDIHSGNYDFSFVRDREVLIRVHIHICSQEKCDLPLKFNLEKDARGLSLSKEILNFGTSEHYIAALNKICEVKNLC